MTRTKEKQFDKNQRGGFRPGAGRKKGSGDHSLKPLRDRIALLIDDQWEALRDDFKKLSPTQRIDAIVKLCDFVLPKLSRVETRVERVSMQLSVEERLQLLQEKAELLKKVNGNDHE